MTVLLSIEAERPICATPHLTGPQLLDFVKHGLSHTRAVPAANSKFVP